jgi:hypothetical protein
MTHASELSIVEQLPCIHAARTGTTASLLRLAPLLLFLSGFMSLSIATASRYPYVWIDEVSYADPAINYVNGFGFTSSCWYQQPSTAVFAGNVPGYSALMVLWLRLVGTSLLAVRSFAVVLMALACILIWYAAARSGMVRNARYRLLLVAVVATDYSIIFSYAGARPDVLCIVLCSALWAVWVTPSQFRLLWIAAVAITLPWTGLQTLIPVAVLTLFLFLVKRKEVLPQVLALALGIFVGLTSMLLFFLHVGVLKDFLASISPHTGSLLKSGLRAFSHHNTLPKDFSFFPLCVVALYGVLVHPNDKQSFRMLRFALFLTIAISVVLVVVGKFPTYYGWMVAIPMATLLVSAMEASRCERWRRIALAGTCAAIALGVVPHVFAGATDWKYRNYDIVEHYVGRYIDQNSVILGDWQVYYAAKRYGVPYFSPFYFHAYGRQAMTPNQIASVNLVVVAPDAVSGILSELPGTWKCHEPTFSEGHVTAFGTHWEKGFLSLPDYLLQACKRQ